MQFIVGKCEVMRPGTKSNQSESQSRVECGSELVAGQVQHLSLVSNVQESSRAALAKHKPSRG